MADKRKPQPTPGTAILPVRVDDDFTTPAALYCDAIAFLVEASNAEARGDRHVTERNLRATLSAGFAALEGQLNQIAFAHAHTHRDTLDSFTLDVLEERESTIDEQGNIVRRTKFYPFEARFAFVVYFITGMEFDRGSKLWGSLKAAKALRDTWTHPKPPFDSWALNVPSVWSAIVSIRDTLAKVSNMIGDSPPPWLTLNVIPDHTTS